MIGRLLGYLEVMGLNVIDDVLRHAGNVLKTFPVSGGEAVNEGDITDEDLNRRVRNFRKHQNARTREEFLNLMTSDHGHIVIEAGSGSRDAKDERGYLVMEPFARAPGRTCTSHPRPGPPSTRSSGTTGTRRSPRSWRSGRKSFPCAAPSTSTPSARRSPASATGPEARPRWSTPTSADSRPRSATAPTTTPRIEGWQVRRSPGSTDGLGMA